MEQPIGLPHLREPPTTIPQRPIVVQCKITPDDWLDLRELAQKAGQKTGQYATDVLTNYIRARKQGDSEVNV